MLPINDAGRTIYSFEKKMNLDPSHTPYRKTNSEWVRHLDIKAKTIKLVKEHERKSAQLCIGQFSEHRSINHKKKLIN